MDDLTNVITSLSIARTGGPTITPFQLTCGEDKYLIKKEYLVRLTPYFGIACQVGRAATSNKLSLHRSRENQVRAMMQFVKSETYYGPVDTLGSETAAPLNKRDDLPTGDKIELMLEMRSVDRAVLEFFRDFEHGKLLHGDLALKMYQVITSHELFQDPNEHALQCIKLSHYRCYLHLLPRPIQLSIYNFLWHVKTRDNIYSTDSVFHAKTFATALKYMLAPMKPHIAAAFRYGVKPWLSSSRCTHTRFLKAAEIVWKLSSQGEDAENNELVTVLSKVMAENWGWMCHDDDVRRFMMDPIYEPLYWMIVREDKRKCRKWETKLWEKPPTPEPVRISWSSIMQ